MGTVGSYGGGGGSQKIIILSAAKNSSNEPLLCADLLILYDTSNTQLGDIPPSLDKRTERE